MKRIATAAVAATTALTLVATPAMAEEKVGSSDAYQACKTVFNLAESQMTETQKAEYKRLAREETNGSSTPSGICIQGLLNDQDYRGGTLALLIGVPLGLVALLGVAAAYNGVIPGVELPALPF